MTPNSSVANWLSGVRQGDPEAAQRLWERYFQRLVALANDKLPARVRRAVDGEDVALSAFRAFFEGVERGRFPDLHDQTSLWNLLVVITARKATSYLRQQSRDKRGGGAVRGESGFGPTEGDRAGIEGVIGDEPTPEFACSVAEEYERLLDALGDEGLRAVAVLKMEGYTVEEIAARLKTARRTVERRLGVIRKIWQDEGLAGTGDVWR